MPKKCLDIAFGRCHVSRSKNLGYQGITQSILLLLRQVQAYFAGPSQCISTFFLCLLKDIFLNVSCWPVFNFPRVG